MQHHLRRIIGTILYIPLAPIIADGIRKCRSVLVECRSSDGTAKVIIVAETGFGLQVPKVECTIGASSGADILAGVGC